MSRARSELALLALRDVCRAGGSVWNISVSPNGVYTVDVGLNDNDENQAEGTDRDLAVAIMEACQKADAIRQATDE